jgi:hypothetical protein
VKITKVESILLHLPAVFRRENVCTDLALNHNDQTMGKNNYVDASAEPVQRIFEQNRPVVCCGTNLQELNESVLQLWDDSGPGLGLTGILRCEAIGCVPLLERAHDRGCVTTDEFIDCAPCVGWHEKNSTAPQSKVCLGWSE